jgi:hypothetical protein
MHVCIHEELKIQKSCILSHMLTKMSITGNSSFPTRNRMIFAQRVKGSHEDTHLTGIS